MLKKCTICRNVFIRKADATTADERTLCLLCRKAAKEITAFQFIPHPKKMT